MTPQPLVQISRCYGGGVGEEANQIHISVMLQPYIHIRVALTPEQFAEALFSGRKTESEIVRWIIQTEGNPP